MFSFPYNYEYSRWAAAQHHDDAGMYYWQFPSSKSSPSLEYLEIPPPTPPEFMETFCTRYG